MVIHIEWILYKHLIMKNEYISDGNIFLGSLPPAKQRARPSNFCNCRIFSIYNTLWVGINNTNSSCKKCL